MTISIHQIRAGRAMKNWNQHKLAAKAEVAVPTIANIEIGKQKPSARTLRKIRRALENAGIEFIDNDGVRKKKDSVKVFRGQQEYMQFFDFVHKHARDHGGSVYMANFEGEAHADLFPNFLNSEYYKNMIKIRDSIDFRILVKEGDHNLIAQAYATYRWVPKERFTPIQFEVFGDYLAIQLLSFAEPIIFLIKNKKTADLYREKFLLQWDKAIEPEL